MQIAASYLIKIFHRPGHCDLGHFCAKQALDLRHLAPGDLAREGDRTRRNRPLAIVAVMQSVPSESVLVSQMIFCCPAVLSDELELDELLEELEELDELEELLEEPAPELELDELDGGVGISPPPPEHAVKPIAIAVALTPIRPIVPKKSRLVIFLRIVFPPVYFCLPQSHFPVHHFIGTASFLCQENRS